jgi:hypothetical protein
MMPRPKKNFASWLGLTPSKDISAEAPGERFDFPPPARITAGPKWTGKAIRHVVHPFAKESEPSSVTQNAEHAEPPSIAHNAKHEEPPHQMTASAAAEASGCTVEQAEALLKYLGYRKTEVWLPPTPER